MTRFAVVKVERSSYVDATIVSSTKLKAIFVPVVYEQYQRRVITPSMRKQYIVKEQRLPFQFGYILFNSHNESKSPAHKATS